MDDLLESLQDHLVNVVDVLSPGVGVEVFHFEQFTVLLQQTVDLLARLVDFLVAVVQPCFLVVEQQQGGLAFGALVQRHVLPGGHQALDLFDVRLGFVQAILQIVHFSTSVLDVIPDV